MKQMEEEEEDEEEEDEEEDEEQDEYIHMNKRRYSNTQL